MKNVKYGQCIKCGKTYPATPDLTTCTCGGVLEIVYDYDEIKKRLTKAVLAERTERTMWRYRELLPIEETTEPTPLCGWAGPPSMTSPASPRSWASNSSGSRTTD